MSQAYPRERFESYLSRFNCEDATAFEDFLHPQVRILNGTLELLGIEGMKAHYRDRIWPDFFETLNLQAFVSDEHSIAVKLWTNFRARHALDASLFGPAIKAGDEFNYRGVIYYTLRDGLFDSITVSYNSFTFNPTSGPVVELGIPGGH